MRIKRLLDVSIILLSLPMLLPLLIIISFFVRVLIGKGIFFKQRRPGFKEKIFTLYKFRTMNQAVDFNGNLLPDSERINGFGRFMRSSSFDEIPSLWNVLKGEMSLVGPRPLLESYLSLYSQEERKRHDVLPGITGWAQINGRNSLEWEDKFKLDLWYVENQSIYLDLRIIFQTLASLLFKKNINYSEKETMPSFKGHK